MLPKWSHLLPSLAKEKEKLQVRITRLVAKLIFLDEATLNGENQTIRRAIAALLRLLQIEAPEKLRDHQYYSD